MATLFVSHGPPAILLMEGKPPDIIWSLGNRRPHPQGVLGVSAHWETADPMVTMARQLATIYDFGGPRALFQTTYNAPHDDHLHRGYLLTRF